MDIYFIRLLLNVDPSINPQQQRDLNSAARRDEMFLPYRALSNTQELSV
jgi:hypothetical protein